MELKTTIDQKTFDKLNKYGFDFQRNIADYLHDIYEEIWKQEQAQKRENKDPFKSVVAAYTGGGIWLFYGELKDGNYFLVNNDGFVLILDESPANFDESLYEGWQQAHLVEELTEEKRVTFCDNLADRLLRRVDGDDFGGLSDSDIKEYKKYWRLPL